MEIPVSIDSWKSVPNDVKLLFKNVLDDLIPVLTILSRATIFDLRFC